ncbi:hypothetical protein H6771_00280 [Candidatus Peribacteria bacterium]|nr:hypothetical protein [Candidatus Peribacteria bacterium]
MRRFSRYGFVLLLSVLLLGCGSSDTSDTSADDPSAESASVAAESTALRFLVGQGTYQILLPTSWTEENAALTDGGVVAALGPNGEQLVMVQEDATVVDSARIRAGFHAALLDVTTEYEAPDYWILTARYMATDPLERFVQRAYTQAEDGIVLLASCRELAASTAGTCQSIVDSFLPLE